MNLSFKHSKESHQSGGPSGFHKIGRDPYVDWAIIFSITAVIVIVMAFIGFLTFESARARLDAGSPSAAAEPVKFDSQGLTNLLSKFDGRAAERAKLQKSYDGPSDPSL